MHWQTLSALTEHKGGDLCALADTECTEHESGDLVFVLIIRAARVGHDCLRWFVDDSQLSGEDTCAKACGLGSWFVANCLERWW